MTIIMDYIQHATDLNSKGVELCNAGGRHDQALDYFKRAIAIMSSVALILDSDSEEGSDTVLVLAKALPPLERDGTELLERNGSTPSDAATSEAEVNKAATDPSLPAADEDMHFIFRQAFSFHIDGPPTPGRLAYYIAVIEFNMALVLHLRNTVTGGEKVLRNAMYIYDLCLEHLTSAFEEFCFDCCPVLFATLNNKAEIFYQLSRFEMVRGALNDLLRAIIECRDRGILSCLKGHQVEGFLFNIMMLRDLKNAPAA